MKISKIAFVLISLAVAMPAFAQKVTTDYLSQIQVAGENKKLLKIGPTAGWQNLGPSGTWWRDQSYVTSLSLTADQQKKMDDVFQQSRLKLIDLTATLDKEELILEPLLKADRLDETKVAAQIDKVADARAGLEKANARMLLGIRLVLTPEQWMKLNSSDGRVYINSWAPFVNWQVRPKK